MMERVAWKELQGVIEDHCKNVKQTLAQARGANAGKCKQGLVKTLEDAGFRNAGKTQRGMWLLSLALPDLYTPGDNAPFNIMVEGIRRRTTEGDLQTMSTTTSLRT